MQAVKVTARLANELIGAAPQLDALLVKARCRFVPPAGPHERYDPAPAFETMPPIPIHREMFGGWLVHRCSSPILDTADSDRHQRIGQHFPRELAMHLEPSERGVIATTNGPQKSMYLPVRMRLVRRVVWFALLHERPARLRAELKRSVTYIGQDRSRGGGRVAEWTVEPVEHDWSWFAPHQQGTVLMRQLPWCDALPKDLIGYVRDFDAVTPPYWHPQRKTNAVRPV